MSNKKKKLKLNIVKKSTQKGIYEFHISRKCRDKYEFNGDLFSLDGNIIFANFKNARIFTDKFIQKQKPDEVKKNKIRASEFNAIGLIDEIYHYIINLYKKETNDKIILNAYKEAESSCGSKNVMESFKLFLNDFPNNSIYKNKINIDDYLKNKTEGIDNSEIVLDELILLWLSNTNLAYKPYQELFNDKELKKHSNYLEIMNSINNYFKKSPVFKVNNKNLIDTLRAPALNSPKSIKGQLEFILHNWGKLLSIYLVRILSSLDFLNEEEKLVFDGFHSIEILDFKDLENEPERFSPDKDWMPKVVMIAKSIYIWLDQLSKKYNRTIYRLDQIPDEELDQLQKWGFNALWLIGIWERSQASKKIKRICGNPEAEASAYSLFDYVIAQDLGGQDAYMNLSNRTGNRGIKLASDMVPNHTGIDSKWIHEHPDWFIYNEYSPFPSYTFNGENLSNNGDFGIYIEDKYYSKSDAAVVFKRVDFKYGDTKYIYHGNDGTSMPWNDTAQLNFLKPEVRESVIQTILHVAGMFPVIRFDAAMTLTKKHYQRLWFPQPGSGGDIPSRAEHSISNEQFHKMFPVEFWREVVDRVAKERPDTLLLAEAFWLMEGYFVRTLGMHRVYNSAFMNMLKSEENKNYRYTIKNILEFNPEILKRFVNFMNNPDEQTAVAQFGKSDKYFGVCLMLSTMPGLPMFGHGQIEGYSEKYGMEYRKAYWNEQVDWDLVGRHEREIFPLLRKRYLFAEVRNFLMYDFYTKEGYVNENVFAYSNRSGDEKALIVYNNKYEKTSGWFKASVGFLDIYKSNKIIQKTLGEGLGLHNDGNYFAVFKDFKADLFYIRSSKDIYENGIFIELGAFKYHVFMDVYEVEDNIWQHYSHLNSHLDGRGVNNINEALKEIIYKPVHNLFREIVNPGMLQFIFDKRKLNKDKNINKKMIDQFEKKLLNLIIEIKKYLNSELNEKEIVNEIIFGFSNLIRLPYIGKLYHLFDLKVEENFLSFLQNDLNISEFKYWIIILIYLVVNKLGKIINIKSYEKHTIDLLNDWLLDKIIRSSLMEFDIDNYNINKIINLIKIIILDQSFFKNNLSRKNKDINLFQKLISDSNVRLFINVNLYNNILWFNKEDFELLLNNLFIINFIELIDFEKEADKKNLKQVNSIFETIQKWKKYAQESNYQLDKMYEASSDLKD